MKIKKIKFVKNGLKGVEVTYQKVDKKDGLPWKNDYKVTYRYPVIGKLAQAIIDLGDHFGRINNLKPEVGESYYGITVVGLECSEDNFAIEASVEVIPGCLTTYKTPVLNADSGYEQFEEAMKKVDQVLALVDEYVNGDYKFDANQIVMNFHKNDENFDIDAFNLLNHVDRRAFMIKELEDDGVICLRDEPMMKAVV